MILPVGKTDCEQSPSKADVSSPSRPLCSATEQKTIAVDKELKKTPKAAFNISSLLMSDVKTETEQESAEPEREAQVSPTLTITDDACAAKSRSQGFQARILALHLQQSLSLFFIGTPT